MERSGSTRLTKMCGPSGGHSGVMHYKVGSFEHVSKSAGIVRSFLNGVLSHDLCPSSTEDIWVSHPYVQLIEGSIRTPSKSQPKEHRLFLGSTRLELVAPQWRPKLGIAHPYYLYYCTYNEWDEV